ncbi:hypothetical protein K443DRAFT_475185 [Laccaria amethystina LaAM-08-1]|uniref:Uncharacterized protein n=1 Tax=Laccaria amethystina LaAM-08-1 TaxID=1095629 RepID=A0A0C9WTM0_9AGAR|nr:hypothetical protein K443DRAFT_475185 [Laccaria amethystina LaAM-08-1]
MKSFSVQLMAQQLSFTPLPKINVTFGSFERYVFPLLPRALSQLVLPPFPPEPLPLLLSPSTIPSPHSLTTDYSALSSRLFSEENSSTDGPPQIKHPCTFA